MAFWHFCASLNTNKFPGTHSEQVLKPRLLRLSPLRSLLIMLSSFSFKIILAVILAGALAQLPQLNTYCGAGDLIYSSSDIGGSFAANGGVVLKYLKAGVNLTAPVPVGAFLT